MCFFFLERQTNPSPSKLVDYLSALIRVTLYWPYIFFEMSNDPLSELPRDLSVCYLDCRYFDTQVETERIATERNTPKKCACDISTPFVWVAWFISFYSEGNKTENPGFICFAIHTLKTEVKPLARPPHSSACSSSSTTGAPLLVRIESELINHFPFFFSSATYNLASLSVHLFLPFLLLRCVVPLLHSVSCALARLQSN